MSYTIKNRLMILGSVIIFGWAFIWANIVKPYSNFVFRIIAFGLGFAFFSFISCIPIIWFASSFESQASSETQEVK